MKFAEYTALNSKIDVKSCSSFGANMMRGLIDMASEPPDTQRWLKRLRGGEMEALAELFGHYRHQLRQMVELRIGHQLAARFDPSDVLQEAYMDAARKIQVYLDNPKVSAFVWLRGLAWDRLAKLQREHLGTERRSILREVRLPENSSVMLANWLLTGTTPSRIVARSDLRECVQNALRELPDGDREVILMRHFERMSNNEVAETLGLSVSGATRRHGRALMRLKDALQADMSKGDLG